VLITRIAHRTRTQIDPMDDATLLYSSMYMYQSRCNACQANVSWVLGVLQVATRLHALHAYRVLFRLSPKWSTAQEKQNPSCTGRNHTIPWSMVGFTDGGDNIGTAEQCRLGCTYRKISTSMSARPALQFVPA